MKIRLTEEKLRNMIESIVREAMSFDELQAYRGKISDKSDELDDRLQNNTDDSMYAFCEEIGEVAHQARQNFVEAKKYIKQMAKQLNEKMSQYQGQSVMIYVKPKSEFDEFATSDKYVKFPAKLGDISFMGDFLTLSFDNYGSQIGQTGPLGSGQITSRSYDFTSLRIIPMSEEEGGTYKDKTHYDGSIFSFR